MIPANKRHDELSRRSLLTGGLAGGFLLAFHLPLRAAVNEPVQPPDVTSGKFAPNAFIRIDADFSKVALQHAPPNDKFYGNPVFGLQATGNSNSVRAWWKGLRSAGASA